MKKSILIFFFFVFADNAFSQDFNDTLRISILKDKQLILVTGNASVDLRGYSGTQLLVTLQNDQITKPPSAKGMKKISGARKAEKETLSFEKDTSVNLQTKITITGNAKHLIILVPQQIFMLSVLANSLYPNAVLSVSHFNSQLDIHAVLKKISVSDVTGPFKIQSDNGDIILKDIHWDALAKWNLNPISPLFEFPYMIQSRKSDIKIYAETSLKATFDLKAPAGTVLSNMNLNNNKELNGGGTKIYAVTNYGNIYLQTDN